MKRFLKWLGIGLGTLAALAVIAAGYVYFASEREVHRIYTAPLTSFRAPTDVEAVLKGKRLATIYGCNNSCHGPKMEGAKLYDEPGIARINAPNLTHVVREYSDTQLERLIRRGVKRDGTSTWIMPSPMFSRLSDEDLGNIIAFVRSAPVVDGPMREVTMKPLGRIGILAGKFKPLATQIPAERHAATTDKSDSLQYGRYLTLTACTECHGADLKGGELVNAPNLVVTTAYSDEDFYRLMRTGVGIGNRKLGLMTEVGETRFPSFTDDEVAAIRQYLKNQFGSPIQANTN